MFAFVGEHPQRIPETDGDKASDITMRRFRQFVRFTQPLESGSRLGWRVWDEGFFDLNDTDWGADTGFAQNRLFLGLGWGLETSMPATLEFGYLNQYISRPSRSDAMNHILAVTWLQSW